MPLKILVFNRSFYPDVTATGQLLTELCETLCGEHGCEVTVVAGMPLVQHKGLEAAAGPNGLFSREEYRGVRILRVRNTAYPSRSFRGRVCNYLSYFFLGFLATWRTGRPDVVMTLTDPPVVVLLGWWAGIRWRVPFVVSLRDLFPEAAAGLNAGSNPVINGMLALVNRWCLPRAGKVIALGALMQRRLQEKGVPKEKIEIITDWADTAQITPQPRDAQFAASLGLEGKFVVMYAGNIGASSGLEFVLDTAQQLQDNKDIVFVMVGEGVMKPVLEAACREKAVGNIRFLPFYPRDEVSRLFGCADVFLVPLKKGLGGFSVPSKVYAVLASGKPYIASVEEESEVVEITRKFECGLISRPEDPAQLAEKIRFYYQHPAEKARHGENARKASASFDRTQGAQRYYTLLNGISAHKKGV